MSEAVVVNSPRARAVTAERAVAVGPLARGVILRWVPDINRA